MYCESQTRSRLTTRVIAAGCSLALLVVVLLVAAGRAPAAVESRPRPSFVVIQTDDQTLEQLYASFTPISGLTTQAMPNTLALIAERGATFSRYYTPYSLCAPSRSSLLTGRYAHNNGVRGNVPPSGGNTGFEIRRANTRNIATWLQADGYRTIHVGKYLNSYGDPPYSDPTYVPPGWTDWNSVVHSDTDHYFYGYELNNNGQIDGPYGESGNAETREYGERDDFGCPTAPLNGKPCYYQTDVLSQLAADDIWTTPPEQPFYLQLDYTAPHGDFRRPAGPEPPVRYYETFDGAPFPHNSSEGFNEGNVNDKPHFIRAAPFLSETEKRIYRVYYDKALASLRAIDDGVKRIIDTIGAMHRLRNTYIIFTSDNGFFYGEHRLTGGKFLAYEPSTHLPLLIRGPGIRPGTTSGQLVSTIDIAPTILELAGLERDKSIDGTSFYPFAHDPELRTRRPLLFESFVESSDVEEHGGALPVAKPARASAARARRSGHGQSGESAKATASIVAPPKNYRGIRLGPYKYIEWPDGEKELYNITKDPNELNNRVRTPNLFPIRNFLHRELERLESCRARTCREVSGKLPLTRKEQLRIKRKHEKEQREREREKKKKEREREKKHQNG
jgi:N-acetylglucosamine-6-sulfatase